MLNEPTRSIGAMAVVPLLWVMASCQANVTVQNPPPDASAPSVARSRLGAQNCVGQKDLQPSVLEALGRAGVSWSRWFGHGDVTRNVIQRGGSYSFADTDAALAAAAKANLKVIGQLTSGLDFPRNDPLETAGDSSAFAEYVSTVVERYDGDTDFGTAVGDPAYPGCDSDGDGKTSDEEKAEWAITHRIHAWELMKEPLPPESVRPDRLSHTPEQVVAMLRLGHDAAQAADPEALVLFGGVAPSRIGGPQALRSYLTYILEQGAADYFDVLGVNALTEPVDEMLVLHNAVLTELGLDKPLWVLQVGTHGGGCGPSLTGQLQGGTL